MPSILTKLAKNNPSNWTRRSKGIVVIGLDLFLLVFSLWAAFGFRLGIVDPTVYVNSGDLVAILIGSGVSLAAFRLYRLKLNAFDLTAITRLAGLSFSIMAIAAIVDFFANTGLPRSLPILYGATFFSFALIARIVALRGIRALASLDRDRVPVAIYGAGSAGVQLASALKQSHEVRPLCFFDDNPNLAGLIVSGMKVYRPDDLERVIRRDKIRRVLIAIPSLSSTQRSQLIARLSELKCEIQDIPSYVDLISGKSVVSDLRPVTPDELLNRDKVTLDIPEIAKSYAGRSIMVTGAGGSIGSELCRQLLSCNPRKIVLFERSEHALYEIDRELLPLTREANIELVRCLASVTERAAIDAVIAEEEVEVILHAAAYKHVPLVEENEVEGARNNILGTHEVAEAARAAGIERFILISTDKAVRPTNVMGSTKRIAEFVVQDLQNRSGTTKFSMVRFGNVLGSSGSVVPLFNTQIGRGGPVTVTHEDVTRYFMTIPEAARLVLLAGSYSQGDDLFVLDMGEPVKIIDLARKMIELTGRSVRDENNPGGDIEIRVTGLRPGEKLYEELLIEGVSKDESPHEKIFRAREKALSEIEVVALLRGVSDAVSQRDAAKIRALIEKYVERGEDNKLTDLASGTE